MGDSVSSGIAARVIGGILTALAVDAWAATPPMAALAPDFALPSDAGSNVRLSELRGQPVVLVFWGSHCSQCSRQVEDVAAIATTYHDAGLEALAIELDDDVHHSRGLDHAQARGFQRLLDRRKAVGQAYGINQLPALALIDRDGRLRYRHDGYQPADAVLVNEIRVLIDDPGVTRRSGSDGMHSHTLPTFD